MQTSAGHSIYHTTYAAWQADPEAYWAAAAARIDWDRAPERIFDPAAGPYGRWFPDARLNTCHNAVDRHVAAGRGAQPAIIWDSPMTGRIETLTYAALLGRVSKLAGALAARGVGAGDRVVIYMPMVPEAAIGMLACARLGAVHSVVFGGFAAAELAARIADAKPKVILAASCGLEPGRVVAYKPLLDAAIALSPHKPDAVLVLQREQAVATLLPGRDEDLAGSRSGRRTRRLRPGRRDRPAVYPVYQRHHGQAEGRGARQWRACRGAAQFHGHALRHRAGRGDVHRFRCRLGGRAFLHRLCAAADRRDDGAVRGQAGRHAGCRHLLAGLRPARRQGDVHRADRHPRHQARRPGRQAARRSTTSRSWRRCSSPASAAIRRPPNGRPRC